MEISKIQCKVLKQLDKYVAYIGDIKMYKRFHDDNNDNDLYREIKKKYPKIDDKLLRENIDYLEKLGYLEQGTNLHPNYKEIGVRITQSGRNYIETRRSNLNNKIISFAISFITTIITSVIINFLA